MGKQEKLQTSAPAPEPSSAYVIMIDPVTAKPIGHGIKTGGWDAAFFGCCANCIPNCCMVSFCPCVSVAQIAARLGVASFPVVLVGYILAGLFGGFLQCLCVFHLRATTRERFDIPGSCCGDCWASLCCTYCVVAQMATHVKSYRPGSCSFGSPDTLPGFRYGDRFAIATESVELLNIRNV